MENPSSGSCRARLRTRITLWHLVTRRKPVGMPMSAWRVVRLPTWMCLGAVILILSCGVFNIILLFHWEGSLPNMPVPSGFIMAMISSVVACSVLLFWLLPIYRDKRFARLVIRRGYEVCLNCGYALHALPEAYQCPECGATYDKSQVRDAWRAWISR